jgi:nucleotide-binding universal stress UspA family protein
VTAAGEAPGKRRILVCYDGSPESERALERVAEVASGVPSEVTVVSAAEPIYRQAPYTGYADPAEATDADLIVVGSRHRGVVRRLLLGSVSGELVVEASSDVLVVR